MLNRISGSAGRALVALSLASLSQAATYYVSTTGSDANQGTSTSPLATIRQGLSLAQPGDTILLEDGRYGASQALTISKAGTSAAWITIRAQNKGGAVLDGEMQADNFFTLMSGAQFLRIENFDMTSTLSKAFHCNGGSSGAAHDIVIKGNHIHNIGNINTTTSSAVAGVYVGPPTYNFTFEGNEFDHIGRLPTSGANAYNHDHALYLEGTNILVASNVFHDNTAGWSIQFATGMANVSVVNNTFYGANPQRDGDIELWGAMNNLTIQNNIFYGPRGYAIDAYQASMKNVLIDHNTICCSNIGVVANTAGMTVSNNRTNTDPLFVNASSRDFHLQAGSPAIDAGATVASAIEDFDGQPRPQGGGDEIGAYEFGGPAPAVSPSPVPAPAPAPIPTPSGSGLVANWKLDDGNGTLAQDAAGSNVGTIAAVPTWVATATGYALAFDGKAQYVRVNESPSLEQSSELTVALWISPKLSPAGDQRLLSKIWSWDIKLNGSSMRPQFSSGGKYAQMNYSAAADRWQHLVFSFSSGTVKAYVNGQQVQLSQNTFTDADRLPLQKAGLYIGTDSNRVAFASGMLNEVRVYDRVLSDSEVSTLYSQSLH